MVNLPHGPELRVCPKLHILLELSGISASGNGRVAPVRHTISQATTINSGQNTKISYRRHRRETKGRQRWGGKRYLGGKSTNKFSAFYSFLADSRSWFGHTGQLNLNMKQ